MVILSATHEDTAAMRKARGAFFTPASISRHIATWAIRSGSDRVLEPSAGDAEFLVAAVKRLRELDPAQVEPIVYGVEIHASSARAGSQRIREAGGIPQIETSDFFLVESAPKYDVVIGNPPYIRYQDFSGEARTRSRSAALRGGVSLTGLASSWAAFTVHSSLFLKKGGRLGLVLPAELLSVNYAAPVRRFLLDSFKSVDLVLFEEQVFPEAEADVVLLLADGFGEGPAKHATFRLAKNTSSLVALKDGIVWSPVDPADKWTASTVAPDAIAPLQGLREEGRFTDLESWGDTTLGIVTGNNKYFTLSPDRAERLGLTESELLRLSPPGSAHLRGLALTQRMLAKLGRDGKATYLFKPGETPSAAAQEYIESGERINVHSAYKCRKRRIWYQVPIVKPADLLLTCMNADTPRLTTNIALAHHLNSVHGVYLKGEVRELGAELLPIASLNSITLLHAEMVGRAYGGGILKIEPREADRWVMPSAALVEERSEQLRGMKSAVSRLLRSGRLLSAVAAVDRVLLIETGLVSEEQIQRVRVARTGLSNRRAVRAASGPVARARRTLDGEE